MPDLLTVINGLALTPSRLANARIIAEECRVAGLPPSLILAAIVNAYAESRLDADAMGDNGKSVGLFQLHESGGGRGMTVAQRKDPRLNTRRILSEYQAARGRTSGKDLSQGKTITLASMDSAYANGATVAQMAGLWSFHVERPWDALGEVQRREALTAQLLGPLASVRARQMDAPASTAALAGSPSGPRWVTLGVGALFALTLILSLKRLFR